MRLSRYASTLGFVALVAPPPPAQDDRPTRSVADRELQTAIHAAISSGIAHLKRAQSEDASWPYARKGFGHGDWAGADDYTGGLTALALYALAASGVAKTDPVLTRGLDWCKAHPHPFAGGRRATYSASLLVLALTRIDPAAHRKWIHQLAKRLADSQLPNGMWSYELRVKRSERKTAGGPPAFGGAAWLTNGDNSNTQFATLALWSAQTATRFRVPSSVWRKLRKLYERTQLEDGGWSYKDPATKPKKKPGKAQRPFPWPGARAPLWMYRTSPTMTSAALVSYAYAVAAGKGGIKALPAARKNKAMQEGVKVFLRNRDDWANLFRDLYYAYAVERLGTVLGVADEDWYTAGARIITERQSDDGRWPSRWRGPAPGFGRRGDGNQVYETSLALLFLSKATAQAITPRK